MADMTYVITDPCIDVKDTACVDACPVDCIHPRRDEAEFADAPMLFINPTECINCGACEPACPVSAIYTSDNMPESQQEFVEINALYFENPAAALEKIKTHRENCAACKLPGEDRRTAHY